MIRCVMNTIGVDGCGIITTVAAASTAMRDDDRGSIWYMAIRVGTCDTWAQFDCGSSSSISSSTSST